MLALTPLLACAVEPLLLGVVGDERFVHEHDVSDVHVTADGELLTLSGCSVQRWSAEGKRLASHTLDGCTAGLAHGHFSGDGRAVINQGLMVGEGGVWPVTGGARVHASEQVSYTRLCAGGAWHVDGSRGLQRLDLETGEVTYPTGEHGTAFLCVDDQWILDEHGHAIEPDGTLRDLGLGSIDVVGTTGDGAALVYHYGGLLQRVDRSGAVADLGAVLEPPQSVVPIGGTLYVSEKFGDIAWALADWKVAGGPFPVDTGGLDRQDGHSSVFEWRGAPWAFSGPRLHPLGEASGPLDTTSERFFFDREQLWVCHGAVCEGRRLDALDGPARQVVLPRPINDDAGISPSATWLAQSGVDVLFRTDLRTGEVATATIDGWPDAVSVDDGGRLRWILNEDEDEDDIYKSELFVQRAGASERVDRWAGRDLLDAGWQVPALRVDTIRWPDGRTTHVRDGFDLFEGPRGEVFVAHDYGSSLAVLTGYKAERARLGTRFDAFGPWGDGAWIAVGQSVRFLDGNLREVGRLTIPWPLGDDTVEGAGSPDGAHFAARQPDGRIAVWRVGPAIPARPVPEPDPMTPWTSNLRVGEQLGAPTLQVPAFVPADSGIETIDLLVTLRYGATLPSALQRLGARRAVEAAPTPWDEELADLRRRWLADPAEPALAGDVKAYARKQDFLRELEAYEAELPAPTGPAFGLAGCHPAELERTLVPPAPATTPATTVDAQLVVLVPSAGPATWLATVDGYANSALTCWRSVSGAWSPARDAAGQPVAACALVRCAKPPSAQ